VVMRSKGLVNDTKMWDSGCGATTDIAGRRVGGFLTRACPYSLRRNLSPNFSLRAVVHFRDASIFLFCNDVDFYALITLS